MRDSRFFLLATPCLCLLTAFMFRLTYKVATQQLPVSHWRDTVDSQTHVLFAQDSRPCHHVGMLHKDNRAPTTNGSAHRLPISPCFGRWYNTSKHNGGQSHPALLRYPSQSHTPPDPWEILARAIQRWVRVMMYNKSSFYSRKRVQLGYSFGVSACQGRRPGHAVPRVPGLVTTLVWHVGGAQKVSEGRSWDGGFSGGY